MFGEPIFFVLLLFTSPSAMLIGSNLPTISQLVGLVNQMNHTIIQQMAQMSTQQKKADETIAQMNHTIIQQMAQTDETIAQMNRTIHQQNQQINQLAVQQNKETHQIIMELNQLNTTFGENLQSSNIIAFSATRRAEIVSMGDNQPIEFEHVITNLGNGYDKRHGHFVAPIKGVYQFSTTMFGWSGQENDYELVKNGVRVCYAYSTGNANRSQGSCTAILLMEVNDMVWVRFIWGGRHLYGDDYSIFSGILIKQIK